MSSAGQQHFSTLHVTDYAAAYEGAFIRQLRMLDDEIRSRGGAPSAIALTRAALEHPWAEVLRRDGWSVHEIPAGTSRAQARVARQIAQIVLTCSPAVLHVHFGTYDLSARRAIRHLRRTRGVDAAPRLVWHYRTALEEPVGERSLRRRSKDLLKFERAGKDVDLFVGVTQALADEVVARGAPAERARGIVAGCDTETFRADAAARARVRAELDIEPHETMLLHMGWSWYRKGGDLLVDATQRLLADPPDGASIVACSIGAPDDAALGPVRRLPMTSRVHELHQAADIFISASRSEGFGNGLVEAMACERVAVAAAAEGQLETFAGLAGVCSVPVDDAPALDAAIRQLLAQRRSWGDLGSANRAHVLQRHSMRRWARDMADAYAELVPAGLLFPTSPGGAAQEVA